MCCSSRVLEEALKIRLTDIIIVYVFAVGTPHVRKNGIKKTSKSGGLRRKRVSSEISEDSPLKLKLVVNKTKSSSSSGSGNEAEKKYKSDESDARDYETPPEEDDSSPGSKKRKKARTTFTGRQIFELERQFERKKYLSSSERAETARLLGVTETQVSKNLLKYIFRSNALSHKCPCPPANSKWGGLSSLFVSNSSKLMNAFRLCHLPISSH